MFNEDMYKIILLNEKKFGKNKAKEILSYNSSTLLQHLFYIFLEYENSSLNGWIEEIYYYYDELPELRSRRKKISKKELYDSISNEKLKLDKFHKVFVKNTKNVNYKFNDNYSVHKTDLEKSLFNFINDYINWLSEKLYDYTYNDVTFSIEDVENKLNELYDKYKIKE